MLKPYVLDDRICAHSQGAAHAMEVPPGARLLFCNGQVGARPDGTVPDGADGQLDVIFDRLDAILTAADMGFADIVRLTIYATDKAVFGHVFRKQAAVMGDHRPPAILLVVGPFPRPGVVVEVEAVAAKVP